MKKIEAVTKETLNHYYNRTDGNLYWLNTCTSTWELVDGFSEEDCLEAMKNKIQFAFVNGSAVSSFKIN